MMEATHLLRLKTLLTASILLLWGTEGIVAQTTDIEKKDGYYYLVTSEDELVAGARYLIASKAETSGETINIMSTQNPGKNNRGVVSGKTENNQSVISVPGAGACEFVLGTYNGAWTFYDEKYNNEEGGYLYAAFEKNNYLNTKSSATKNCKTSIVFIQGTWDAEITFDGNNYNLLGYNCTSKLFSCYRSTHKEEPVRLYKLHTEFTIGADGYATFYTDKPFVMPENVQGGIITAATDGKLTINYNYTAGDIVPAKTALLLKGTPGKYNYERTTSTNTAPTGNLLHGADAVDTDGNTSVSGTNVKYYILSKKDGKIGFYWAADNGTAIQYQTGKAFLAIDSEAGVREYSLSSLDGVTGIDNIEATTAGSNKIYTPTGVCVGTNPVVLPKGIYIINGKKVAL